MWNKKSSSLKVENFKNNVSILTVKFLHVKFHFLAAAGNGTKDTSFNDYFCFDFKNRSQFLVIFVGLRYEV